MLVMILTILLLDAFNISVSIIQIKQKTSKYYLLVFCLILSQLKTNSQDFGYKRYREQVLVLKLANQYLENDDLKHARKCFKRALKIRPLDFYQSAQAAYCFGLAKDEKLLLKVIEQLPMKHLLFCSFDTAYYCLLKEDILDDSTIVSMLNTPNGVNSLKRLQNKISNYHDNINWTVFNELKNMHDMDQSIRNKVMDYWFAPKSQTKDSLLKLMAEIDSANFKKFIEIIKQQGWPDVNRYGSVADVLLWHINIELKFIDSVSYNAALNNLLDWETYEHFHKRAIFFDYFFQGNGYKIPYKKNKAIAIAKLQASIDYLEYYHKVSQARISFITNQSNFIKKIMIKRRVKTSLNSYGIVGEDVIIKVIKGNEFNDYLLIERKE